MATLTITIADSLVEWIEERVRDGDFRDESDFVGDLVAQDLRNPRSNRNARLTMDDLRRIVEEARASGVSNRSVADIVAEGERIARERGFYRE